MNTSTKIRRTLLSLTAGALLAAAAPAGAAEVTASLSTREAYVGAPISLRVEIANASSQDEPRLPDIAGLDIQSAGAPSRSTQTTIINGRRTDRTSAVYTWRLLPRREGAFVIPPIAVKVDGQWQTTSPLRLVATKSETGDLLFVEVTGQQQKIYVGQSLKLTLNVWIKPYRDAERQLTVSESDMWRMISDATNWGAFAERLTELANNQQRPGGEEVLRQDASGVEHSYYRYRIEATIYPKRAGQVDAGDVQVVVDYPTGLSESRDPFGSMFDSNFFQSDFPFGGSGLSPFNHQTLSVSDSRPVVANATVAPIEVTPVPTAGCPTDYRGAVGRYEIVTHATPTSVKAGDPITLHIGVSGDGPMNLVQPPPLAELPQLTADFKVTNEPLAGVVEDSAKLFTTSIRPRRAGITQIPAISFSFFDPAAEAFVTVQSEPIAIQVAEADRLALGSIIGGARTHETAAASEPATPQLDLSNYTGIEAIASEAPHGRWPLVLVLLIPPLFVASWWGLRQRNQLTGLLRGTARQRVRTARQAIAAARSPADVATAVKDYLAGFLQRPSASLTRLEITTGLQSSGCQSSVRQLDDVLARCEQAAYACSVDAELGAVKSSALAALAGLSSIGRRETGAPRTRPNGRRRVMALACLLLAAIAVAAPAAAVATRYRDGTNGDTSPPAVRWSAKTSDTDAVRLGDSQCATLLSEANRAYQQGRQASSSDAATAKEAFSTAAGKYQLLLDSGIHNSQLYCNLGNAYLQSGSLGRAIANYERALLLDPTNRKAQTNLAAARRGIPSANFDAVEHSWSHTLDAVAIRLSRSFSPTASAMLLAAAWALLWATVLMGLYLPNRRWRHALIAETCLLFACIAMVGLGHRAQTPDPHGIVAVSTAVLRQAPGENFPAVTDQPLPEGQSLTVLRDRESWLQVQAPDGQIGWIAAPQIERVALG